MVQEMTVHRALSLLKSTEKRIAEAIAESKYIEVRQGKKDTINGVPIEQIKKEIQGNWDKINQLISNYEKIKRALSASNAGIPEGTELNRVKVCDKEYTLAELIIASDNIYGNRKHSGAFKQSLLSVLKITYKNAINRIERQHDKVENELQTYLKQVAGSDKQSMSADEIQRTTEVFHANGDFVLVDPLNLKQQIESLEAEIQKFKTDADAMMSEKNALTVIKVDLSEIE